jgi:hypothetical protein
VSGRILNKLNPLDEGVLCPTFDDAQARLQEMLGRFATQGCAISVGADEQGNYYVVTEQSGAELGQFYVV